MKTLSIIIPIFNEEENIKALYKDLDILGKNIPLKLEIIFVNDGSIDKSSLFINELAKKDKRIKLIEFSKNFGQTSAFDAGIKNSIGELIVTLDADLQNDPADILILYNKLMQGFDVVVGWRKGRQDPFDKKLFSFFANYIRKSLTGETIHDSGCSLRIYKKEVFNDIDLYGEMHRFIPSILNIKGFKITEVPVHHRKRIYGKSKYGFGRLIKGLLDLVFVVFLLRFAAKPLHIFGGIGMLTFFIGLLVGIYLSFIKIFYGATLSNRPLLTLGVLLMVLGTQFFVFGILAEILIRIYFKTHSMKPYTIKK